MAVLHLFLSGHWTYICW